MWCLDVMLRACNVVAWHVQKQLYITSGRCWDRVSVMCLVMQQLSTVVSCRPRTLICLIIFIAKLLSLSLRFNGHLLGELGLASVYWSKGWWSWWWQLTTGAIKSHAKLQSNHHHQQTNIQFFQFWGRLNNRQMCYKCLVTVVSAVMTQNRYPVPVKWMQFCNVYCKTASACLVSQLSL